VVMEEMNRMGGFLLAMAQERAQAHGIQAEAHIRHGELRVELKAAVREEEADMVILGRPAGDESAFRLKGLEALAAEIEEETEAETRIL